MDEDDAMGVTIEDVRRFALTLPRSYEAFVGGRVKFRVGRLVYLSFSRDGQVMGFAFPKEERDWLIGGSPAKFMLPDRSDLRYHWVLVRMAAIDEREMRELVIDAWRMVVPKGLASAADEQVTSPGWSTARTASERARSRRPRRRGRSSSG
jgi:hypothetical protein